MRAAAVVVAGGRSRRMGTDKAALPWQGTTLLGHLLRVLAGAVDGPLVVVGPAEGPPPRPAGLAGAIADRLCPVTDPVAGRGPLQGIAAGLEAAADAGAARAFVSAVDLPLLRPEYVRAVLRGLAGPVEVALPVLDGFRQPLAAAYDTALGGRAAGLIAEGAGRPGQLFAASRVVELDAATLLADPALRRADPDLDSVRGVNTPAELAAVRDRA